MNSIRFVKRKDIHEAKWNDCIYQSPNTLPYALTWYLDSVAENWDAFILEDYQAVMPLVWLRKLGVPCLYQPYYCQQLGVFGTGVSPTVTARFLKEAAGRFPYIHINLHAETTFAEAEMKLKKKANLLLDLSSSYPTLRKGYSENHRRNVSKAEKAGLIFSEVVILENFQSFYLENVIHTGEKFEKKHEKIFLQLTRRVMDNQYGQIYAVLLEGRLLAASLVLCHHNRLINIINTSNDQGKKRGASHFLFDGIIKTHANTATLLDFEGSSIPAIARFYQGFGPYQETFYLYQTNILKTISQRLG